jgi:hypothetical protein
MTYIDTGHTGAKRTSWSEANPRDLMLKIRKRHPTADRDENFAFFLEAMDKPGNQKYLHAIFEYYHTNAYKALVNDEAKPKPAKPDKTKPAAKEKAAAAKQQATGKAADTVTAIVETQAKIVLLDMVLPNGIALRDCTGDDCRSAGGWLRKVGDLVGDNKVGDVLDENKLRSIYTS